MDPRPRTAREPGAVMEKAGKGGGRRPWMLGVAVAGLLGVACTTAGTVSVDEPDEGVTPPSGTSGWQTNWEMRVIDLDELTSGGPPRDGIPPIDEPKFESVEQATEWLIDREPVVLFQLGDDVRAYPLRILTWHEIVNDEAGGIPVAITFCPLCNSAIAFDRRLDGEVLRLGTSGLLRKSDLVMWDDKTESLWQQIDGLALVGDLAGRRLEFLPAAVVPWGDFRQQFPEGLVLSRDTGFAVQEARYGQNPYVGYDTRSGPVGSFFDGELDPRLPAMERVAAVTIGETDKAYPFSVLAEERVVHDRLEGQDIAVFWGAEDTASALSSGTLALGRAVGAATVWNPSVDGQRLTFRAAGDTLFVDEETSTTWSLLGQAIEGPLAGKELEPVVHGTHFWFAWAAFQPDTLLYEGSTS